MVGYFWAGFLGGLVIGMIIGMALLCWLTSGSNEDDLKEAWRAGFTFGQLSDEEQEEELRE